MKFIRRVGAILLILFFVVPLLNGQGGQIANVQLTSPNGKPFAAVIDIFPQLCLGRYDAEKVEANIKLLADLGIKRIYFVVCLPGYPSFSNPWISLMSPDNDCENYALESVIALDSPNLAFCRYAKKYGMEAIAVLKPYEGGGGATVPAGAKFFWEAGGRHACVGGERVCFDTFLAKHPEYRVQRKPIPNYEENTSQAYQRLELEFCLDEIPSSNGRPIMPAAAPDYSLKDHPVEFRLWISNDNGSYELLEKDFTLKESIEKRILYDVNGLPLCPEKKRCRVVEISDLDLPLSVKYLAISLHGDPDHIKRLQCIPGSMFRAFGPDAEIPVTAAQYVRHGVSPSQNMLSPEERLWGMEKHPRHECNGFRPVGI